MLLKNPAFITEKYVKERERERRERERGGKKEGYSVEEGKKDLKKSIPMYINHTAATENYGSIS